MADTQPYRGIEFGVHEAGQNVWRWAYYPQIGAGPVKRGELKGTREAAIVFCKSAIDEWLGSGSGAQ
jgi:hypothetical protein